MSINDLCTFIENTTIPYRKGAEMTIKEVNGVTVVEVYGYPETPSRGGLIDVHFINVGFSEAIASTTAEGFLDLIRAAEHGEFANMPLERLKEGPSYIETGAWLGSQELALRFIALGAYYELWAVITPAALGITGEDADRLAGGGMVMNTGLKVPGADAKVL